MANYGIFGHGSSGNGWFTSKLGDFHRWTKKWEPLGHYSVENPMKTAHWLVEKSSKGLADAGIGEGWNTRLNQEADENGDNFALGTTRMGVGVGSVIGAMYGASYLGGGSSAGAGGSSAGGGAGAAAGGTTYAEAGGGTVTSGADGGLSWNAINGDGVAGSAAGNSSTNWGQMLRQGGSTMQNMGRAQQQPRSELEESDVEFEKPDYQGDPYAYSSKRLKTGPRTSMREVMARGASGADPIDQNGVHMASVQALTKRLAEAKQRLGELQKEKAAA